MVDCLLYKLSALGLLLDQFTCGCEFHLSLDLLETPVVPDQSFADQVKGTVAFIFKTEVVVQVHPALDDLAAAITFHFESVVSFFGFGGRTAEEIFKEAHKLPFMSLRGSLRATEAISRLTDKFHREVLTD
jgi:hypothetical protein